MTNLSMLKFCFTMRKHLKNNSNKNKNLTAGHPDTDSLTWENVIYDRNDTDYRRKEDPIHWVVLGQVAVQLGKKIPNSHKKGSSKYIKDLNGEEKHFLKFYKICFYPWYKDFLKQNTKTKIIKV